MSDSLVDLPRARQSLDGLSVGDAFGQRMFALPWIGQRRPALPPGPWSWTDDTHMALSVCEMLERVGGIDQDALALAFVRRLCRRAAPRICRRGSHGDEANRCRHALASGGRLAIGGRGSYGNGAAMRAAPIGAGFWRDPARAAHEAQLSAAVTHAHREGQAGAMAVAISTISKRRCGGRSWGMATATRHARSLEVSYRPRWRFRRSGSVAASPCQVSAVPHPQVLDASKAESANRVAFVDVED